MKKYTNYCNKWLTTQTYNLNAPLDINTDPVNSPYVDIDDVKYNCPTTQEMLSWIRETYNIIAVINEDYAWSIYSINNDSEESEITKLTGALFPCGLYEEAELEAIEAIFNYIEYNENLSYLV